MKNKATKALPTSHKEYIKTGKKVKTVSGFLLTLKAQINESTNKSVSNYLFRGLPKSDWRIKSTAQIRLERSLKEDIFDNSIPPQDEKSYNQALIEHFKHESFNDTNSPILDTDLGILAQLRHYNCATSMIDFTGNPLVALWFACQSAEGNNGVVYTLATQNTDEFIEIYSLKQLKNYTIEEIFDKQNIDKWFYWKPSHLNRRIPVQSSCFVIGGKGINKKVYMNSPIIIEQSSKDSILKELFNNHNIDALTLFPDMSGFADANSAHSIYGISEKYRREIRFYTAEILEKKNTKKKNNTEIGVLFFQRGMIKYNSEDSEEWPEDINTAIKYFNKNIKPDGKDFDAVYHRGLAHAIQNKTQEAIDDLTTAIKIKPNSSRALYKRGNVHLKLNEFEKALNDFDKAIEINVTDSRLYINRGVVKSILNAPKEAINDFNVAIDINPKSYNAHHNRGLAQQKLGKYNEAIKDFNKIINIYPENLGTYNKRGNAYAQLEDFEKALNDFNKTIKLDPENPIGYMNRINAYHSLGNFKAAMKDYNKVIEIDPKNPIGYINRGCFYMELDNPKLAIKDFNEVINIDPQNMIGYYNRAHAYDQLKNFKEAIKDYDKAIYLDPKQSGLYFNRGNVYDQLKQFKKAIKDFDKAIYLDPKNSVFYSNRGNIYDQLKNFEKAIKDFDKAIYLDPEKSGFYSNRGNVYAQLKNFEKAIKDFDAAINLEPNIFFINFSLGQTKYLAYNDSKGDKYRKESIKDLNAFIQKAEQQKAKEEPFLRDLISEAKKWIAELENPNKKKVLKSKQATKKKLPKSTTAVKNKKNNKPTKSKKD